MIEESGESRFLGVEVPTHDEEDDLTQIEDEGELRSFITKIGETEVLVGRPRGDANQPYEIYLPQVTPDESTGDDDDENDPERIDEQTISFRGGEAEAKQVFEKACAEIREMEAARQKGESVSVNDVYRAVRAFIGEMERSSR